MSEYETFLERKQIVVPSVGIEVHESDLPASMFPWQRAVTQWALRKGRAAIFANTGLGKTLMQLAWAKWAAEHTLILAPLAVARQTVREGERWGIPVTYARDMAEARSPGITITNYERLERFDAGAFGAVVLDESSILANFTGKTKKALVDAFQDTPMRLCCTATPAPNDTVELTNHADFLGIMSPAEMISMFFTPKGSNGRGGALQSDHKFRLKGHARAAFFRWLASWSMAVTLPSDLGFSDDGYLLPSLEIQPVTVPANWTPDGKLFAVGLSGITERASARRATVAARVQAVADLVHAEPDEPWLLWCGLNDEADQVRRAIPEAVEVRGSDSAEDKAARLLDFAEGRTRVLVTKTDIAGFGLNLQRCARMAFVGVNDSYQSYYQAIRRCWRFGQTRPVKVYVVVSDVEMDVYHNVLRKEGEAAELTRELIRHVAAFERDELGSGHRTNDPYTPRISLVLPEWLHSDEEAA